MRDEPDRAGQPTGLGSFLAGERRRILEGASPERRAQLAQAERSRAVYRAWNAVCAGTREGSHVTGLRYLPETNELLVYLDAASWTQEMTMLREIIRARMELGGVELRGFKFRTSKAGYHSAASAAAQAPATGGAGSTVAASRPSAMARRPRPELASLTPAEDAAFDAAVAPIEDPALAQALKSAMQASARLEKSRGRRNEP